MSRTDEEKKRKRLEQLCSQWAALGPEDEAVKLNMQGEIFELVYALFPGREDAIGAVFMADWKHFDSAKGSACGFFSARIKWREKDACKAQEAYEKRIAADAVETDGGESESLTENLPAGWDADPEEMMKLDDTACELLTLILELSARLRGRANNPARRNYFRLFFTDNVASCLHTAQPPKVFVKRERDLFAALKREFLDFFMEKNCRTAADICASPLKPYGALVEGRDMEETKLPLPGDVYVSYLDRMENTRVNQSAVSQQKQLYFAELRKWLY